MGMTQTSNAEQYEIVRVESDGDELIATGSLAEMYALRDELREELDGADDNYKIQPAQD
jgi:hypothetical protein